MISRHSAVPFLLVATLLAGCAPPAYYVTPREWSSSARKDSIIQSYRQWLQGHWIFLDPGHGGEDRVNQGPAGDAIEADVNLRVGLALRDFLTAAGAHVILSREKDTSIALADRPLMAVRSGAEIFISLHHNATGTADAVTNYASVYYHSRPGRRDFHPANQDLARHIERDMGYAMRNPAPPYSPTFDGTLSDFDIYPNSGFAVLRDNPLPAVLIEGSFFTHPPEERRLAVPEFNQIEAWGIFLGLGKYFKTGFPQLTLLSDTLVTTPTPLIAVGISPWKDAKSVDVSLDTIPVSLTLSDSAGAILISPLRKLRSGIVELNVFARNGEGKSAWPFRKPITVMLPAGSILASLRPDTLPLTAGAAARLVCSARDVNGDPVADGCPVRVLSPRLGVDTTLRTKDGVAICYLTPPKEAKSVTVEVRCQKPSATLTLNSRNDGSSYASGTVRASDSAFTIGDARITLLAGGRQFSDTTWPDGRFMLRSSGTFAESLLAAREGYFPSKIALREPQQVDVDLRLRPVAGRKLFGRTFLVDPRYGGTETGERNARGLRASDINLEIAWRLTELLRASGANARLVRSTDTTMTETERARRSADSPRGMYVRIDAGEPRVSSGAEIYRSITNRRLAEHMLSALAEIAGMDTSGVEISYDRFFNDVAMGTVSVRLPSVSTGYYDSNAAQVIDRIAWCLFGGILRNAGFVDPAPEFLRFPDPAAPVLLEGLFRQIPDRNGEVYFFGLDAPGLIVSPSPTSRTPLRQNP